VLAATHCGSGCTLGDLVAEWVAFFFPGLLVALGYHHLFQHKMFAAWLFDYILAFLFGVAFQYFTIVPMRHLPPGKGLLAALKADALSLRPGRWGCMGGWLCPCLSSTATSCGRPIPYSGSPCRSRCLRDSPQATPSTGGSCEAESRKECDPPLPKAISRQSPTLLA